MLSAKNDEGACGTAIKAHHTPLATEYSMLLVCVCMCVCHAMKPLFPLCCLILILDIHYPARLRTNNKYKQVLIMNTALVHFSYNYHSKHTYSSIHSETKNKIKSNQNQKENRRRKNVLCKLHTHMGIATVALHLSTSDPSIIAIAGYTFGLGLYSVQELAQSSPKVGIK